MLVATSTICCHLFALFSHISDDMMTPKLMPVAANNDAELVVGTLAGDRDAFGQIVSRYQSLIASLTYSATGNLGQSEDLAQETFITAWKHLVHLRERDKLRSWLCGIARNRINNFLRREGREPLHKAGLLDEISETRSPEPLPVEYTISNEEQAILWRSLERIPEIYREPLVLFYREHQSIEAVAQSLELTEDTVKQRLSRGRKMLHEQVLAFVEGALERTNPSQAFTLGVLAGLPGVAISTKGALLGATAVKGGATVKAAGAAGLLGVIFGPLMIFLGNYLGYRIGLAEARSDEERRRVKLLYGISCVAALGFAILFTAVIFWTGRNQFNGWQMVMLPTVIFIVTYLLTIFSLILITARRRHKYYSKVLAEYYGGVFPEPAWEYRSRLELFGLPLVHIRIGDRFDFMRKPVTAWIAVGNYSVGGLLAFGGVAVAPFSIGALAIGLLPFGGLAFGIISLGGLALGVWSFGGVAIGWQALGCGAIAWSAAAGNFAWAHDYALGNFARAAQANNDIARQFIKPELFFRCIEVVDRHWFWMNLLWIAPLFVQWQIIVRRNKLKANQEI